MGEESDLKSTDNKEAKRAKKVEERAERHQRRRETNLKVKQEANGTLKNLGVYGMDPQTRRNSIICWNQDVISPVVNKNKAISLLENQRVGSPTWANKKLPTEQRLKSLRYHLSNTLQEYRCGRPNEKGKHLETLETGICELLVIRNGIPDSTTCCALTSMEIDVLQTIFRDSKKVDMFQISQGLLRMQGLLTK